MLNTGTNTSNNTTIIDVTKVEEEVYKSLILHLYYITNSYSVLIEKKLNNILTIFLLLFLPS